MAKLGCPMRLTFVFMGILIWLGIYLTGFGNVHWILYLPAIGVSLAAISGMCLAATIFGKVCKQ